MRQTLTSALLCVNSLQPGTLNKMSSRESGDEVQSATQEKPAEKGPGLSGIVLQCSKTRLVKKAWGESCLRRPSMGEKKNVDLPLPPGMHKLVHVN